MTTSPDGIPAPAPSPDEARYGPGNGTSGLAIAGFILSFFGGANIVGLILSIIAFRRAPGEDRPRGLALAGIILSAAGIAIPIVGFSITGPLLVHAITVCNDLGHGTHHVNGVTYTCN